jgi:hypothetical protein
MLTNYKLAFSFQLTHTTVDCTLGTLIFRMLFHLSTEYSSIAVVRAVQFNVLATFVVSSGDMINIVANLELCLAAILSVGAVDLQLTNPFTHLLLECGREILTATVRTGVVPSTPLVQAFLAEPLLAAVDKMRLAHNFHTNTAS